MYDLENARPKDYPFELEVHYEDDDLAVVFKPAGLVVSGNQYKTLYNALPSNLKPSKKADCLPSPLPVHRLDKATSGLILIAKTKLSRIQLGELFEKRAIQKTYSALVMGKLEGSGKFESLVDEKEALTYYESKVIGRSIKNDYLSLVELKPVTGRTHQLRVHLSQAGFPILGDSLYSPKNKTLKHKGLFLCSHKLQFTHPHSNKNILISCLLPEKFEKRLKSENNRWNKYHSV